MINLICLALALFVQASHAHSPVYLYGDYSFHGEIQPESHLNVVVIDARTQEGRSDLHRHQQSGYTCQPSAQQRYRCHKAHFEFEIPPSDFQEISAAFQTSTLRFLTKNPVVDLLHKSDWQWEWRVWGHVQWNETLFTNYRNTRQTQNQPWMDKIYLHNSSADVMFLVESSGQALSIIWSRTRSKPNGYDTRRYRVRLVKTF